LVEERVEAVLACAEGVDLTHQHEYRKSGFSADSCVAQNTTHPARCDFYNERWT
jgi:hypothetical protein